MSDPYKRTQARFDVFLARLFGKPKETFEAIKVLSNVSKGAFVLDIGGGDGRIAELFADEGYQTIVLDPSREMLSLIRNPKIIKQVGTAKKIPLENNTADLIYCVNVFHHFNAGSSPTKWSDIYDVCAVEMIRVLKRNGKIIIMELNPTSLFGRIQAFSERNLGCRWFRPDEIVSLFSKFGCSVKTYEKGSGYVAIISK